MCPQGCELRAASPATISVIIVSWNTSDLLEQCLTSLKAASLSQTVETIVVDNGSVDGSPEMVEKKFPEVRLIRSSENLGFAKANNIGIRQSTGRYISLVNSDVRVLPGSLDRLAEYLDKNPAVGNVGPRVLNPDLTLQSSCRRFPTLWNNFCSAIGLATAFRGSRLFSGEHMYFFSHDRISAVDVLVGCFWMLRRDAISDVGLLDETFFMYGEDVDWCRRCWNRGWRIVFLPGAEVIHNRGGSSKRHAEFLAITQQRSVLRYWSKHRRLSRPGITAILFGHHAIRYLAAALSRFFLSGKSSEINARQLSSLACLRALLARSEGGHPGTGSERAGLSEIPLRFITFYKRNGLPATAARAAQAVRRAAYSNLTVVYGFDFSGEIPGPGELPPGLRLERKTGEAEICASDLQAFGNFWNPAIALPRMKERFAAGASLWLLRNNDRLAGYGWTLRGRTMEPHFVRFAPDDVHLFDYYVAPEYRGRGLNPLMVNHILRVLAAEGVGTAFIEAAQWNKSQLASLRKTPFRRLGNARKMTIRGRTIVWPGVVRTAAPETHSDHRTAGFLAND